MTIKNALTFDLQYGDGIAQVWQDAERTLMYRDGTVIDTHMHGKLRVELIPEDVCDELAKTVGGDLATGTPSIEVSANGMKLQLNWQEAYNLDET